MGAGDDRLQTRLSRRVFVRSAAGLVLLPTLGCGADGGGDAGDAGAPGTSADAGSGPLLDASAGADASMDNGDASLDASTPSALCQPFVLAEPDFPALYGGNGTVEGWRQPELDAETWRLSIEGLVRNPRQVSLAELEADVDNHVTVINTLQCVFGTRGTAVFKGVPLRVLLERAGLQRASTRRLRIFGADGFSNNLKLADIFEPEPEVFEPLVAFQLNGEPLPGRLGFPARLLLCDRYGFKNTKWLTTVEASASDEPFGQYQSADFGFADDMATIDLGARLDGERSVPAGQVVLCGHGLSGFGGIAQVQVSVDDGPIAVARLLTLDEVAAATPALRGTLQFRQREAFPWPYRGVWAPWELAVTLEPGEHTLRYRVVDRSGRSADGFETTVHAT